MSGPPELVPLVCCDVCEIHHEQSPCRPCAGYVLCETCGDLFLSLVAWAGQPGANLDRLIKLANMAAGELDGTALARWDKAVHLA